MRPEDRARLLAGLDLFEALSDEDLQELGRTLPMVSVRRGEILHGPGHRGRVFFLLLDGRVRVYRVPGREEVTLFYARAGDVFGEAAFRERDDPQGVFAQAVEHSEVALMRVEAFERLVRERPAVGSKMVELLSRRLSFYADRLADAASKDVTGRLSGLILHLAESEGVVTHGGYKIPIRYTHQQLGEMIGARRVAVTRALGELREAGVLTLDHRRIHVRDMSALRRAAGG